MLVFGFYYQILHLSFFLTGVLIHSGDEGYKMKKRRLLLNPIKTDPSGSLTEPVQTDWDLCCLCQVKTKANKVARPDERNHGVYKSGYDSLEENILKFHKLNALPFKLDINRINDGSGISQTLKSNNAFWHTNCNLAFCDYKLERAQKRENKRNIKNKDTDCPSPVKTRRLCNPMPANNKETCFFCEEYDVDKNLFKAATKDITKNVYKCAKQLCDRKLLAKLAPGDMIAINAKYHLNCLNILYNRYRSHLTNIEFKKQSNQVSYDSLVFAELIAHIEEARQNTTKIPIFYLKNLVEMYKIKLAELREVDVKEIIVHATRFKLRLLKHVPGLTEEKEGKDIILIFSKDIGPTIQHAINNDMDEEAVVLSKAAQIVRKEIFSSAYEFSGSFEKDCERNAVPKSLLAMVQMILEGPSIGNKSISDTKRDHISLTISELLQFNAIKRSRAEDGFRHNKDRETPLPIYLSMLIHAKTRSRDLIDTLFNLGLCVSYDRLMSISTELANSVCDQYHANQVVCPPQLSTEVFTCGAVDNIDHNPSSTTACDSFHGTAITLTQFPTTELPGECQAKLPLDGEKRSKISPLPHKYTFVPPVTSTLDPVVPTKCVPLIAEQRNDIAYIQSEQHWLTQVERLVNQDSLDENDNLSWAAYHASNQPKQKNIPSKVALLPLFREKAQTTCMISHAMQMVSDAIKHVNPTQTTVIAADQPLFALIKQVQWTWPETHGEDKFVAMMGGLHIEMNLLKLLGDWLRDSGWTTVLTQAGITTPGRAEAILSGSNVTRSRYAHQVTAASLKILRDHAYQNYQENEPSALSFDEWCEKQCQEQPQFKYWTIALYLELLVLQFVRSIRERNFKLYNQSLSQIIPWLFALDHINYARWLPVHIADMLNLIRSHPDVYFEFMKGHFAVQKTNKVFSAISIDQCHEQMNKLVKGDGGAVGLTEDPQALERWMVAGPEISRLIHEFENSFHSPKSQKSNKHHDQNLNTQRTFATHVNATVETFKKLGNPFLEVNGDLLTLDTKVIMGKEVIETVNTIEENGRKQYNKFLSAQITANPNNPLSNTIKKISIPCSVKFQSNEYLKKSSKLNTWKSTINSSYRCI